MMNIWTKTGHFVRYNLVSENNSQQQMHYFLLLKKSKNKIDAIENGTAAFIDLSKAFD